MKKCTEFAVFEVSKETVARVIALSHAIFSEMNADGEVITMSRVLVKTDNPDELCWHLEWVDAEAAKSTTAKWPTFASTKEFQEIVGKNIYYGHFLDTITE